MDYFNVMHLTFFLKLEIGVVIQLPYKLADMHKENMTMSENYKCNQSEVKRLNTKLLGKEEEIIRLKQSADSKAEQIKRLTEQYNNSQKPAL